MGLKRRTHLLPAVRRDRISGLWLALLLLFVPFIQPLSEANAAGKPFAAVICSTFGVPGQAAVPGLADDCATCIAGQHAPQSAVPADGLSAKVFLPVLQFLVLILAVILYFHYRSCCKGHRSNEGVLLSY